MPTDAEERAQSIARYFIGSAFEDTLYHSDNNAREKACAWKIMRSPQFNALTNDSFYWRAVGIPLDLIDKSIRGDIDMLFAMRRRSVTENKTQKFARVYRSFELKTSKVSREGRVSSLKTGKFQKTRAQLEKLCRTGSPQTFLLEAFIVEAGFADSPQGNMPRAVREAVSWKYEEIARADYGYVTLALEQIEGFAEEHTGILWPVTTMKEAKTLPEGATFKEIVLAVESYINKIGGVGYKQVITYCYGCKHLTWANHQGPYSCTECGEPLI